MEFIVEILGEVAEFFVELWVDKICAKIGIELTKPDMSYADEISAYRKELLDHDSSMDGCATLRRCETAEQWLNEIALYTNEATLPEGLVLADQFIYVRKKDRKIVGMIQLRKYLNDFLAEYCGHIGYSVRPTERRKGYATKMLKKCLKIAKQQGLQKVLITCADDNEASRRTILANGGVYERTTYYEKDNENLERYWITL